MLHTTRVQRIRAQKQIEKKLTTWQLVAGIAIYAIIFHAGLTWMGV